MNYKSIPKGRGMVKFSAFAAMPEQFEGINQIIQEQLKIQKPVLDDQQKEEIERILFEALETKSEVNLWYYKDAQIYHEIMDIQRIDIHNKVIVTTDAFRFVNKFLFDDIIDCQLIK
ncbi:YolD-like family protein [Bacillus thuringiensis]|uniref:YolD-like family protein n=1 Tax=Bacillus thuringiensis TaxID=1428 RepID=UPI003CF5B49C